MKSFILLFLALGAAARAQLAVFDPANYVVNAAVQSAQAANHVEVLRQWATELEQLNRQIRQLDDLISTQRRIREIAGDPVGAGAQVTGVLRTLGADELARPYGETLQAVRRVTDAALSLRRTSEGLYRRLDDRTALGATFTRRTELYKPYAAVERQADNLEQVFAQTDARETTLQAELATSVVALRDAPTQADVDKLNVKVAAVNGQLAVLANRRRDESDKLRAQQILNENQATKERHDLWEKQIAEERQSLDAVNAWQRSIRLTPTSYTRP
jgi:hypothetical protein